MNEIAAFLLCSLACLRLAILLSIDTGPAKIFSWFRAFLKRKAKEHPVVRKSDVHKGIECVRCSTQWCALPIALYAYFHSSLPQWLSVTGDVFLLWNALSMAAILWSRAFPAKS